MDRQICVDCRRTAPETETDYTLISGKHGWRLQRRKTDEGWDIDWRCPDCWRIFKKAQEEDAEAPRSVTPASARSSASVPPLPQAPPSGPSVGSPQSLPRIGPAMTSDPPPAGGKGGRSSPRRG